ncbi:hypothetical protein [Kitasatospora cheerisanensis]|uniref:hypothetical protein n=1 Tax=Kitasatospora cheerisanensis TaxID=81942 RepID=UPI0012EDD8F1|nr:hypothetical protein [Kitasatospora cheerisanensis]
MRHRRAAERVPAALERGALPARQAAVPRPGRARRGLLGRERVLRRGLALRVPRERVLTGRRLLLGDRLPVLPVLLGRVRVLTRRRLLPAGRRAALLRRPGLLLRLLLVLLGDEGVGRGERRGGGAGRPRRGLRGTGRAARDRSGRAACGPAAGPPRAPDGPSGGA